MGSLRDQLISQGFVSKRLAAEARAQEQLDAEEAERHQRGGASIEDLDGCASMEAFKRTARGVLSRNPLLIGLVISKAHRFRGGSREQRAFISFFYRVRDTISLVPQGKLDTFLARAFRRRNPVIRVPE